MRGILTYCYLHNQGRWSQGRHAYELIEDQQSIMEQLWVSCIAVIQHLFHILVWALAGKVILEMPFGKHERHVENLV